MCAAEVGLLVGGVSWGEVYGSVYARAVSSTGESVTRGCVRLVIN